MFERDGGVDPSKRGAEADVDSGPERDMTVRLAADVRPVGMLKTL